MEFRGWFHESPHYIERHIQLCRCLCPSEGRINPKECRLILPKGSHRIVKGGVAHAYRRRAVGRICLNT